jgi:hypothetical protein
VPSHSGRNQTGTTELLSSHICGRACLSTPSLSGKLARRYDDNRADHAGQVTAVVNGLAVWWFQLEDMARLLLKRGQSVRYSRQRLQGDMRGVEL